MPKLTAKAQSNALNREGRGEKIPMRKAASGDLRYVGDLRPPDREGTPNKPQTSIRSRERRGYGRMAVRRSVRHSNHRGDRAKQK